MLSIHLQNLQFKSHHGLYEQETILGNIFIVNLVVKYQPTSLPITNIEQTINYENLFNLIEKRMLLATDLLETLVTEIAANIFETFILVDEINISIIKQNPPIARFAGNVAVSFETKRNK